MNDFVQWIVTECKRYRPMVRPSTVKTLEDNEQARNIFGTSLSADANGSFYERLLQIGDIEAVILTMKAAEDTDPSFSKIIERLLETKLKECWSLDYLSALDEVDWLAMVELRNVLKRHMQMPQIKKILYNHEIVDLMPMAGCDGFHELLELLEICASSGLGFNAENVSAFMLGKTDGLIPPGNVHNQIKDFVDRNMKQKAMEVFIPCLRSALNARRDNDLVLISLTAALAIGNDEERVLSSIIAKKLFELCFSESIRNERYLCSSKFNIKLYKNFFEELVETIASSNLDRLQEHDLFEQQNKRVSAHKSRQGTAVSNKQQSQAEKLLIVSSSQIRTDAEKKLSRFLLLQNEFTLSRTTCHSQFVNSSSDAFSIVCLAKNKSDSFVDDVLLFRRHHYRRTIIARIELNAVEETRREPNSLSYLYYLLVSLLNMVFSYVNRLNEFSNARDGIFGSTRRQNSPRQSSFYPEADFFGNFDEYAVEFMEILRSNLNRTEFVGC